MIRTLAAALSTSVCIVALATPAMAQTREFNIPAGSLKTALVAYARQSGRQVISKADEVRAARSPGARGQMSPAAALDALLAGTGFIAQVDSSGAVAIVKSGNAVAADNRGSPGAMDPFRREAEPQSAGNEKPLGASEDIIVTGTNIRDTAPVGSALKVYSRAEIDRSGTGTLDQFARSMPENFSGADAGALGGNTNAAKGLLQQGAGNNIFGGAAFNLHGLGPGSTLTLLNGRRLAPGGFDGSLVDISQIPLSAIDSIEVLEDGASAIYGSDAIAGVVNIKTRKNFDGVETSFRYGAATDGGAVDRTASQVFGHSWGTGNVLLNYEYDNQGGLDASQRKWIGSQGGPYSLIPQNERHSVLMSANQELSSSISISGNVLYSTRDFRVTNTLNVPGQTIDTLQTGYNHQLNANVSLEGKLFSSWRFAITGNYSNVSQLENQDQQISLPAYNINLALKSQLSGETREKSIDLLSNGTLFNLPGGEVKAAVGGSFRGEDFKNLNISNGTTSSSVGMDRDVASIFGEVFVPIFSDANARPGLRKLELSVAARYDHYSDFGSTLNPKAGVRWQPVAGLNLRATYGTSYQAPYLSQLGQIVRAETDKVNDSSAPGGLSDALILSGGNRNLRPEKSKSWTAGIEFAPANASGLKLSLTYFHVDFTGQIQSPTFSSLAIFSQPILAPFISRNPPLSLVQSYFAGPNFSGDFAGLGAAGVNVLFDDRLANIASTVESGLSFSGQYGIPTSLGKLNLFFSGTHLLKFDLQSTATAPTFEIDDTLDEPTSWKVKGGLTLTDGNFSAGATVNYANGYRNQLYTPTQRIDSWTTADLSFGYRTGSSGAVKILRNLRFSLNIINVANTRPPFVNYPVTKVGQNPIPFDSTNASAVGRLIAFQITKSW